jgi:hypothetical protein
MSQLNGSDPIDRLRAADPVHAGNVPDTSLARVRASVQEQIMTDLQHASATRSTRRPLALLGGLGLAAAALAFAIALSSGFSVGPQGPAGPTTDPGAGGGVASCLAYDPAALPTFDIVFDGTVTAVDGDRVTFDVNTGWKGADGTITLTAPEVNVALVGPLPEFEVGGRYLVTAAGSTINACGYTLDYDAGTAADWAGAFGG